MRDKAVTVATAPGKLVVLGEYAVLDSAPALVFAVNRRASVSIQAGSRNQVSMGKSRRMMAAFEVGDAQQIGFADQEQAARYTLLTEVWQALKDDNLLDLPGSPGLQINLDTDAFSEQQDGSAVKFGLGSSAALSTALAIALAGRVPAENERQDWLERIHLAHQAFQGGKGSGLDVAASLYGGAIEFSANKEGVPKANPLGCQPALVMGVVWTGVPVSTGEMVAGYERWKARDPGRHASLLAEMTATAQGALTAYSAGEIEKFLQFFETYGNQLRNLGEYSGLDIYSREHQAIGNKADSCGIRYKICGAGGGDIGIALGEDASAMSKFAKTVTAEGFRFLELAIDEQGASLQ